MMVGGGYVTLLSVNAGLDNLNCMHLPATIALMIESMEHGCYCVDLAHFDVPVWCSSYAVRL